MDVLIIGVLIAIVIGIALMFMMRAKKSEGTLDDQIPRSSGISQPTPAKKEEKLDEPTPDFDSMSPEELMAWMESLAKRQERDELIPDILASEEATNLPPPMPQPSVVKDIKPSIEDTQTMKAVSKKDTQEMKETLKNVPISKLPEEVTHWMDQLTEQIDDALPSLEDSSTDVDGLDITYPEKKTPPISTAHFSAFYPHEAQPEQRYGIYIYAHAESMMAQIMSDVEKFKQELGGNSVAPRTARTSKALEHDTKITVMLESEELEFEPDTLTKRWHGDWTRYEFEFRPSADLINETAFVRASIMVMGFEIAKIKFTIDIIEPQMQVMAMRVGNDLPENPFARAKMQSVSTAGYDKIFISYSRKDKLIAEAFKLMQEAAGNDVFFDVDDLRTGEDWKAAIARAIDSADYMQVFWSENSATSEWCSYEWDYALNYRCQDDKCREFIRPVWWIAPMPPPPDILSHLNFRRMDFEALMAR